MFVDIDDDIKIVGDKPSEDVRRNKLGSQQNTSADRQKISGAKSAGEAVALKFIADAENTDYDGARESDMLLQRRLLLSFTATAGFEQYINDDTLSGIAQKSFLDTLKKHSEELYNSSSDTGAFSFYYLAFRRGGEVDRRMGQTFAMLCLHDGDPIFQELGEALYCWFSSVVRKAVKEHIK